MSHFDRPGATLPGPPKPPRGSRFGNLSDRLARTFGGYDRPADETQDWDPQDEYGYGDEGDPPPWEPVGPRFPLARLGYDRTTVDEHVAELERELAELQTRAPSGGSVSAEIERIGEQTSAILTVAHDKAHEMTRQAQEQADRCLADAASNAVMITEDAKRRLRQLDSDTDAVWRERARLVEDVRHVASSLMSLADDATARFPAEPEKSSMLDPEPEGATVAMPAAAQPAGSPQPGTIEPKPVDSEQPDAEHVEGAGGHETGHDDSAGGHETEQHWFGS